jgi:hypothetical protein
MRLLASGRADGREVAYVDGPRPPVDRPADGGSGDAVTFLQREPESIVISASTSAAGLLVVSEPYASGWTATVDGEKVDIIRTNHALRGIPVPAGDHLVVMQYEPEALRIGLWTTGFTSVAMLAVWAWALIDRRRPRRGESATRLALAQAVRPANGRWGVAPATEEGASRAARPEGP